MILSESELSQQAAAETLPLRDAFAVLFFVSVGMLFDPVDPRARPAARARDGAHHHHRQVGRRLRHRARCSATRLGTALTISASLAQIGEFSFILASLGVASACCREGRDLILAGAIISILLNPLLFMALDRLKPWLEALARHQGLADTKTPR